MSLPANAGRELAIAGATGALSLVNPADLTVPCPDGVPVDVRDAHLRSVAHG